MTIFKLVDRESGEESVEFASQMVFQRPCDICQGLKVGGESLCTADETLDMVAEQSTPVHCCSAERRF